jgi:hypothetical protein
MNLKEERYRLTIEPKTEVETAYIEEVLGLRKDGDYCKLVRKNAMSLSCIAYLETKVVEKGGAVAWTPRTLAEHISESSEVPKYANMLASFIKRMYKYANTVDSTYHTIKLLKEQLTIARKEKAWIKVAVIAMLLSEVHADDQEAKINKL